MKFVVQILLVAACWMVAGAQAQIPPQMGNPNTIMPPGSPPAFLRPPVNGGPAAQRQAGRPPGQAPTQPGAPTTAASPAGESGIQPNGGVTVQFPARPLTEVLQLYEDLTQLRIIRDANTEQATVTIETSGEMSREDAIVFIEKSLILNGYFFVPAGRNMVKLLSEAKKPGGEGGVPLVMSLRDLRDTDEVVNYVLYLKYLSTEDAIKAIDQVVPRHTYGSITPVPNARALVLTENSAAVRAIVTLMEHLDNKPAQTLTRTFQLTRSDSEDVKKALDEILGTEDKGKGSGSSSSRGAAIQAGQQIQPGNVPPQVQPASLSSGTVGEAASEAIPPKIHAITRRNCLLVVATPDVMDTITKLVEELDAASELRNFSSRTLKYLAVDTAMNIISDAITRGEGEEGGGTGGSNVNSLGQQQQNNTTTQNNQNNRGSLFGNNNNSLTGGLGGSGGLGGGSLSTGTSLNPIRQNNGPSSMVVGKTLLISDPVANTLFASGPPEHLRVLNEIIDEIDRRPSQIIISAVIGETTLTDDNRFGIETLIRARNNGTATSATRGLAGQLGNFQLPDGASFLDPRGVITTANLASNAGFTFYGGIREGLDVIVNALQGSTDFHVISRPTIFAMNNTPANISSGTSFPIATSTQSLVNGGNNNNTGLLSNVQYQDVALSLNIVPLINTPDELTLQISQENSEQSGSTTISGNSYPTLTKQQLTTVVICKNNTTVLLGGLIREAKDNRRTNVPFLSQIPILKHLTGSTSKSTGRRELLIFLQPRIVEGMHDLPPSLMDSPGTSPFAGEVASRLTMEKELRDNPPPPPVPEVKRSRIKSLLGKMFGRSPKTDSPAQIAAPAPYMPRR